MVVKILGPVRLGVKDTVGTLLGLWGQAVAARAATESTVVGSRNA